MPREFPGYHDVDERLAGFRTEILNRMRREDELRVLPRHDRDDLAAAPGAIVTVDSFLGTANTDNVDDVYFPVECGQVRPARLPFAAENPDHPVLHELRDRFDLPTIAGTGPHLERAIRIRDWIKSLFPHNIPYRMPVWNALPILDRGSRGVENFICIHYSVSLVQCCLSVGIQARMINLHRGIAERYLIGDEAIADPPVNEHVVAEVWNDRTDSWVMLDTDFDCHYERAGIAVSSWDIHQAFVKDELDQLTCRRGPHSQAFTALADQIAEEERFFARELPSHYAHVSVLMRNDFLSDPDGPVPVAHLVDAATEPIIWHRGSDLRLQPHLMGPVVVAQPYSDQVPVLTDGNELTGWASADTAAEHWVDIALPAAVTVGRLGLLWPDYRGYYRTSRRLRLDALVDGQWITVSDIENDPEGPCTLHELLPTTTRRLRLVQPPGGGSRQHPDRFWLNQVELFAAEGS